MSPGAGVADAGYTVGKRFRAGMKTIWEVIRQAVVQWQQDGASMLAAALAFYATISLAPLITISLAFASLFYGEEALRGELVAQVQGYAGAAGAEVIQSILANARGRGTGVSAAVSAVLLLVGASAVFAQLQDSLNRVWNVAPAPDRPWTDSLRVRLISMALVLGIGVLLLAFTLAGAALSMVAKFLGSFSSPGMETLWQAGNFLLGIAIFTLLFAALFKVLPDAVIRWRDVWLGALITSALFNVGRLAIGFYLGKSAPGSAYGVAGSLVALLLWIYYSALILLLGAEFTQVLARQFGCRIRPAVHAQRVSSLPVRVDDDGRPMLEPETRQALQRRLQTKLTADNRIPTD